MSTLRAFGVTAALREEYVHDVLRTAGKDGLNAAVRETADQALDELRRYVGGAPLRSEAAVDFRGPEPDPLQGNLYAVSVAALFDPDDLGPDSAARLLIMSEQAPGAGATDVRMEGDG